jgi:glutamate/tyrosine decarboxylase-like PLP-dependent enzyme
MALFRNIREMENALRIPSPYSADAGQSTNLGEITVHGSRRVEVLKLWLSLQHIGSRGLGQLVDEGCRLTEYFLRGMEERPRLQAAGKPDMNILCFRGTPEGIPCARWDEWNSRLQTYLLRERGVFLSFPPYRGARWLRVVLLNPYADEQLVERLLDDISSFSIKQ